MVLLVEVVVLVRYQININHHQVHMRRQMYNPTYHLVLVLVVILPMDIISKVIQLCHKDNILRHKVIKVIDHHLVDKCHHQVLKDHLLALIHMVVINRHNKRE